MEINIFKCLILNDFRNYELLKFERNKKKICEACIYCILYRLYYVCVF